MREFFWHPPDYYTRTPLTDKMVRNAEAELKKKLPSAYIELLKVQNGGSTRYDTYPSPVPTSWADDHVPFENIMGIGRNPGILDVLGMGLPTDIIPLSGDGHFYVCLDYRVCGSRSDPSVVWIDFEVGQEVQLAPSFMEFLEGLVDGNYGYVFGFVSIEAEWKEVLDHLNVYLDLQLSEYPYRTGFSATHNEWSNRDGSGQATFSFYPNLGDKHWLGFPMYAECDWLFSCDIDDQMVSEVFAILKRCCNCKVIRVHTPPWKAG
ncbi:MAG: SMI1/KNR4 family protein [Chloroflexota bacterium]|nr:SMI1/KNR4 family protein [Chloroflexota bacterium]